MLVLDAYNILHVTGVLPADIAGIDVGGLIELVRVSRYSREEVVVVCDGVRHDEAAQSDGRVRVVFSGGEREADDVIEGLLAGTPRSKRAVLVSTDARLRRAAGRHHARVLRSEVFLHQLAIDHAAHARGAGSAERRHLRPEFAVDLPLDRVSVAKWAAEMGVGMGLGGSESPETHAPPFQRSAPIERSVREGDVPERLKSRSVDGKTPGPKGRGRVGERGSNADSSGRAEIADLSMEQWIHRRPMTAEDKPGEVGSSPRGSRSRRRPR